MARASLYDRFRVRPKRRVRLPDWDPDDTAGFPSKKAAQAALKKNVQRLAELQYRLYAESRHAVLVVLQAMDAGGKDGTIRHVMSALNPQSCRVTPFKAPCEEELAHDFLWRIHRAVPRKGELGIFNRSHYEDVLVVRVKDLVPKALWSRRYRTINEFERGLTESNVTIVKFFLHISKKEQAKRLQARLDDRTKHWKINPADFQERRRWNQYARAYEAVLSRCSTPWAPWFIIPSDKKWFRNLAVSEILVETLTRLKLKFPKPEVDLSQVTID